MILRHTHKKFKTVRQSKNVATSKRLNKIKLSEEYVEIALAESTMQVSVVINKSDPIVMEVGRIKVGPVNS